MVLVVVVLAVMMPWAGRFAGVLAVMVVVPGAGCHAWVVLPVVVPRARRLHHIQPCQRPCIYLPRWCHGPGDLVGRCMSWWGMAQAPASHASRLVAMTAQRVCCHPQTSKAHCSNSVREGSILAKGTAGMRMSPQLRSFTRHVRRR